MSERLQGGLDARARSATWCDSSTRRVDRSRERRVRAVRRAGAHRAGRPAHPALGRRRRTWTDVHQRVPCRARSCSASAAPTSARWRVADFDGVCSGDIYRASSRRTDASAAGVAAVHLPDRRVLRACGRALRRARCRRRSTGRASREYEFALPPLEEQRRIADAARASERCRRDLSTALACERARARLAGRRLSWRSAMARLTTLVDRLRESASKELGDRSTRLQQCDVRAHAGRNMAPLSSGRQCAWTTSSIDCRDDVSMHCAEREHARLRAGTSLPRRRPTT